MDDKKSILSSIEQRKAVQRTMGHANIKTTYSYATDVSEADIEMAENDSQELENVEISTISIRASQLKPIEECVQNCVQIAKNDFKI